MKHICDPARNERRVSIIFIRRSPAVAPSEAEGAKANKGRIVIYYNHIILAFILIIIGAVFFLKMPD